jgi:DNA polymerase I
LYTPEAQHFVYLPTDKDLIELSDLMQYQTITSHNLKFDLYALMSMGVKFPKRAFCTLEACNLLYEEMFDKSLDNLSKTFLNQEKTKFDITKLLKIFPYNEMPLNELRNYALQDAKLHYDLWQNFEPKLQAENQLNLMDQYYDYVRLLIDMEYRGIKIDYKLIEELIHEGQIRIKELRNELGFDPMKSTQLTKYLFEDLKLPVLKTTPTGKPAMDKGVMTKYDELLADTDNPIAKKVLEYRGWTKTISTYLEKNLDLSDENYIVHPNFRPQGTVSGRLSCANPNLQQIPRASEYNWSNRTKSIFIPRTGFKLIEFDFCQLELRLVATYAEETKLLSILANPEADVFQDMADQLKMPRHQAKTLTYSILYGAGIDRISNIFKVDKDEALNIKRQFFSTYPKIRELNEYVQQLVTRRGYITYIDGRRRHLEGRTVYKALNSLIQGSAASIVRDVMLRVPNDPDCRLLLQVHDSLLFEIQNEEGLGVTWYSNQIMLTMMNVPNIKLFVTVKEWANVNGLQHKE